MGRAVGSRQRQRSEGEVRDGWRHQGGRRRMVAIVAEHQLKRGRRQADPQGGVRADYSKGCGGKSFGTNTRQRRFRPGRHQAKPSRATPSFDPRPSGIESGRHINHRRRLIETRPRAVCDGVWRIAERVMCFEPPSCRRRGGRSERGRRAPRPLLTAGTDRQYGPGYQWGRSPPGRHGG